jgi:hypothetical protein
MNTTEAKVQDRSTPSFTIRISAAAEPDVRRFLEKSFGYSVATLYPDLFGLATHVANGIDLDAMGDK